MRHAFFLPFWIAFLTGGVYSQTPTPTVDLPGMDLNKDGVIDGRDVLLFLRGWGERDVYIPNWTATVTATPTVTFTSTSTASLTPTSTSSNTRTPTDSPTLTPTPTITQTVTLSPTPTSSHTETPVPTSSLTFTATPTNTASITDTPTGTPTSTETQTLTVTLTPSRTLSPTRTPTMTFPTFDLSAEVTRVMQDPHYPDPEEPQWKPETYRPIVEIARTARLAHGVPEVRPDYVPPTMGVPRSQWPPESRPNDDARYYPDLPETEIIQTASGEKVIRYYSGDKARDIWGDDEQIVYLTGDVNITDKLMILPGTLIIVATNYDDQNGGKCPQELLDEWGSTQLSSESLFVTDEFRHKWNCRNTFLNINGTLFGKGGKEKPIIMTSDVDVINNAGYESILFQSGFLEYFLVENKSIALGCTNNNLISHSIIWNSLETNIQVGGDGYVLSNYMRNAGHECIDNGGDASAIVKYNYLGVGMMETNATIVGMWNCIYEYNTIRGTIINGFEGTPTFRYNDCDLVSNAGWIFANSSPNNIDASNNYWGTTDLEKIRNNIWDGNDGNPAHAGYGIVTLEPILTSPPSW